MRPHHPVLEFVVVAPVFVVLVVVVELPAGEAIGEAAGEAAAVAAGLAAAVCANAAAGVKTSAAAKTAQAALLRKAMFIVSVSSSYKCLDALLPALPRKSNGSAACLAPNSLGMTETPIALDRLRKDAGRIIAVNASASLIDLDDGVLCLEFHSKGNTLDGDTLAIAEKAFECIPGAYRGLVVGNQGKHFSFGANLAWLLRLLDSIEADRSRFRVIAKRFQRVTTGMRTAPFPAVSAPFGLTIGGALELSMYADAVQAHHEMRAALPEVAVGILPDLGGTSELYARCLDAAGPGNEPAALQQAFETIAFMRESTGEKSARDLRFLRSHDRVTRDLGLLLNDAKARVLELAPRYTTPTHRRGIPVLGDEGFDRLNAAIFMAVRAGMATEYDGEIGRAIARVMTGGPGPARTVDHEELLDLETSYFETLLFNPKTRARMEYMLEHGTPLRN
jgi:3-hydroxyacyl-CoA dehydrogenase